MADVGSAVNAGSGITLDLAAHDAATDSDSHLRTRTRTTITVAHVHDPR